MAAKKGYPPDRSGSIPGPREGRFMTQPGNHPSEPPQEGSASRLVAMGLYFYAAMMAAALIWRMGFYREAIFFASPSDEARGFDPLSDFAIGLGAGLVVVVLSSVWTAYTRWGRALAVELAALVGPIGIPNALLLACASGLAEETFFRGALQPRVGLVVASVLFAGLHFVPRRTLLPWTVFAAIAGLFFGILFEWTGNLVAPVTAHIVVNGVNLPLLERRFGKEAGNP